jgi:hypothetical protein
MKRSDFDDLASVGIMTFGNLDFRGKCPGEALEQVTFFNRLRTDYPDTWGAIAVHPRNEGQLRGGQFAGMSKAKAEGMTTGAADIVIPGAPAFVCEMKRQDYTQSAWQDGQIVYLKASVKCGAFVCVALGYVAAWQAFEYYLKKHDLPT